MDPSAIFNFGNAFVLIGWALLLILPNYQYTPSIVKMGVVLVLSALYTVVIGSGLGNFSADSFSTLANVKALFQDDAAVAAGWLHYLAFDLFVGAYIVQKAQENGLPRWLYSLILPFAFMFGPMGYLLFAVVKIIKTRKITA